MVTSMVIFHLIKKLSLNGVHLYVHFNLLYEFVYMHVEFILYLNVYNINFHIVSH